MQTRYTVDVVRFQHMNAAELRRTFLIDELFTSDALQMIYIEVDRCVIGSAVPLAEPLRIQAAKELSADFFCQRRELGVLNIGAAGTVTVDSQVYRMENRDGLYIGRGSKEIVFASADPQNPAAFYLVSFPAHAEHPTRQAKLAEAEAVVLGSTEAANKRTIYKYIHPRGIQSCQLVMGFTVLEPGSVWNTMPPHTHERRMEVYLYFDMAKDDRVFHLMGPMDETRHLVIANREVVFSPSWSIHSGVGTSRYTFCWGMGGENQTFEDMDGIEISHMR